MGSMTFTEKILILSMAFLKLHYTFGFDSCYHHRLLHRSAIRTLLQHNVVKNEQGIEIETKQVKLSSNDNLVEVIICNSSRKKSSLDNISSFVKNGNPSTNCDGKAPLVFIHGSFHASWCWAEHYFIHFASLGYPCYALSLRGTGGTFAGEGISKVKIDDHVEDIRAFIKFVKALEDGGRDPVLIAHSFGGLALMKYLETSFLDNNGKEIDSGLPLEGVILLCSVPPSGNAYMTLRFLTRSLSDSYKIVVGLAAKRCITNAALCRTLFFQGKQEKDGNGKVIRDDYGISDMDLKRYQGYFKRDTDAIIDLNGNTFERL